MKYTVNIPLNDISARGAATRLILSYSELREWSGGHIGKNCARCQNYPIVLKRMLAFTNASARIESAGISFGE